MYTTTSKQQGCTLFKDSHPKCFITTNFDKFHREAFASGGESRHGRKCGLRIVDCGLWTADCGLRSTVCGKDRVRGVQTLF